jgi:hypothetical protein
MWPLQVLFYSRGIVRLYTVEFRPLMALLSIHRMTDEGILSAGNMVNDMEKLSTRRKTMCSATASITNPYDLTWNWAFVFIPRLGRYNLFWHCFPFVLNADSNHRLFSTNLTMRT